MPSRRRRHPRWTSLHLIFLFGIALLFFESQAHLPATGQQLALVIIVGLTYGLLAFWVGGNAAELAEEDDRQPETTRPRSVPRAASRAQPPHRPAADSLGTPPTRSGR